MATKKKVPAKKKLTAVQRQAPLTKAEQRKQKLKAKAKAVGRGATILGIQTGTGLLTYAASGGNLEDIGTIARRLNPVRSSYLLKFKHENWTDATTGDTYNLNNTTNLNFRKRGKLYSKNIFTEEDHHPGRPAGLTGSGGHDADLLGLGSYFSREDVQKARKMQAKQHHPDLFSQIGDKMYHQEKFKQINAAGDRLEKLTKNGPFRGTPSPAIPGKHYVSHTTNHNVNAIKATAAVAGVAAVGYGGYKAYQHRDDIRAKFHETRDRLGAMHF